MTAKPVDLEEGKEHDLLFLYSKGFVRARGTGLPIPGAKDRFYGVRRVADDVARFLEASKNQDPMIIQAGVWTLTDNYSRSDVINRLISKDSQGNTWHPVTHEHCDKAKAILEKLGIAHRLWRRHREYEKDTWETHNGSYSGELRHGDKHGRGTYRWNDGRSYDGRKSWSRRNAKGEWEDVP